MIRRVKAKKSTSKVPYTKPQYAGKRKPIKFSKAERKVREQAKTEMLPKKKFSQAGNPKGMEVCLAASDGGNRIKRTWHKVASYKEASKLCRKFIDEHNLGGSVWTGGDIRQGTKKVGYVSYNGRVWESKKFPSKEIKIK